MVKIYSPEVSPKVGMAARVAGLDAIRFVCALWVVLGHVGVESLLAGADKSSIAVRVFLVLVHNLFRGPSAVIAFFVISGFCIHFPHRNDASPSWPKYFLRRYARILPPMFAAMVLARVLDVKLSLFHGSILWSLLCEEIYYALYPLLRQASRLLSWDRLIIVAYCVAFGLAMTQPQAKDYPSFGLANWILGLPCWLLGCRIAERWTSDFDPTPAYQMNLLRGAVWVASMLTSILRFHTPIGYPLTLNLFALLVAVWLSKEIQFHRDHAPVRFLDAGSRWSYSLYLVHLLAWQVFRIVPVPNFGYLTNWTFQITFVLASAFCFYLLVEKPSHRLARRVSLERQEPVKILAIKTQLAD